MKTLVGILLTVGLAVGYTQAEAQMCKSKHMTTKHKMKTEGKVALHSSKHHALETRCVCRSVSKSGMISAKSYGGYKKVKTDNTLNNGGSPLMPNGINLNIDTINYNPGPMNPMDTMPRRDDLNDNQNGKDFDKPIISNGWENSGLDR
jgi:hypothetical protein